MKLNVGLSKKIGLPDYGSLGASCHVEVELDSWLLQNDLDGFHRHVHNAFVACRQAVQDELARWQAPGSPANPLDAKVQVPAEPHSTTPTQPQTTNGNGSSRGQATSKQLEYANQLATQIAGLGVRRLESLAQKMFSKPLPGLTSLEASGLIDMLKEIKAGRIDLAAALNGAAP